MLKKIRNSLLVFAACVTFFSCSKTTKGSILPGAFSKTYRATQTQLETLLEKDVEEVLITGCPQDSQEEYIKERPALAMIVGYLKGLGKKIIWENSPKNLNYGKQK